MELFLDVLTVLIIGFTSLALCIMCVVSYRINERKKRNRKQFLTRIQQSINIEKASIIPADMSFYCLDCEHGHVANNLNHKMLCMLHSPAITKNGCVNYKDEQPIKPRKIKREKLIDLPYILEKQDIEFDK